MSNHPQWGAYDRGSCTEEACEIERLTHGFEVAVGVERPLPTITNPTGPIGPRYISASACVVGLIVKQVLHGPARRVMRVPLDTMRRLQERVASGKLFVKTNSLKGGAYDERNDPQCRVYHKWW